MKHYPMEHFKETAQEIDKLGWNIRVYKLNDVLILTTPYEVLANIKNNRITIFSCAHRSEYTKRKVKIFIQKYIKEI